MRHVSAGGYFTVSCTAALPEPDAVSTMGASIVEDANDSGGWLSAIMAAGRHRNYTAAFAGFAPSFTADARAVSSSGGSSGDGNGRSVVGRGRARSFDDASVVGDDASAHKPAYQRSNSFTGNGAASVRAAVNAKLRAVSAWMLPPR